MKRTVTFFLWLLSIAVPLAFAVCLLVLFPLLLQSWFFVDLSYVLGVFFLLMVGLTTWSFLFVPKVPREKPGGHTDDYEI